MKRIIDGVAYNTETSTVVATMEYDNSGEGGPSGKITLYQTRGGAFFLHDHEVLAYRRHDGEWQERTKDLVEPKTREEAQEWVLTAGVDLHSEAFGEVPEAAAETAPEATIYARVPASLKAMIEQRATAEGLSINGYVTRCLEQCARPKTFGELWQESKTQKAPDGMGGTDHLVVVQR